MAARLYTIGLSHPGHAARLMLDHKGIDYRVTVLPAGMHPAFLRILGFRGYTVPVLKIDGRRVEKSLAIARELEAIRPEPPLYPAAADARAKIEDVERWGEAELQPVPRRMFRWALIDQHDARVWLAGVSKLPAPRLQARTMGPIIRQFARQSDATAERVRQDLAELPGKLDRVDALVADGTLSADAPNAATFQIGTSVRALTLFQQLRPLVDGRPAGQLAFALVPEWPESPARLPEDWLPG